MRRPNSAASNRSAGRARLLCTSRHATGYGCLTPLTSGKDLCLAVRRRRRLRRLSLTFRSRRSFGSARRFRSPGPAGTRPSAPLPSGASISSDPKAKPNCADHPVSRAQRSPRSGAPSAKSAGGRHAGHGRQHWMTWSRWGSGEADLGRRIAEERAECERRPRRQWRLGGAGWRLSGRTACGSSTTRSSATYRCQCFD